MYDGVRLKVITISSTFSRSSRFPFLSISMRHYSHMDGAFVFSNMYYNLGNRVLNFRLWLSGIGRILNFLIFLYFFLLLLLYYLFYFFLMWSESWELKKCLLTMFRNVIRPFCKKTKNVKISTLEIILLRYVCSCQYWILIRTIDYNKYIK